MKTGTTIEVYAADRDRVNALAAALTEEGPGRFGQKEVIRWLLDQRERIIDTAIDDYAREKGTR